MLFVVEHMIVTHVNVMSILNYKRYHIPLNYRHSVKKSDQNKAHIPYTCIYLSLLKTLPIPIQITFSVYNLQIEW